MKTTVRLMALTTLSGTLLALHAVPTVTSARVVQNANSHPTRAATTKRVVPPSSVRFVRADTLEESRRVRAQLPFLQRADRRSLGLGGLAPNLIVIPCILQTENAYLRRIYKYKAVGTKVKVTCRMLVERIELETWMEHQWLAFWLPSHKGSFSKATNARRLEPTNVRVRCRGREPTHWRAFSFAKVTYLGRDYFADVTSNDSNIACSA